MLARGESGLALRVAGVLVLVTALFAGAVWLTLLDARSMIGQVQHDLDVQVMLFRRELSRWYESVVSEHARQIAAPFLWDLDDLDGLREGTPAFRRLQRRMWQFVYGRSSPPRWEDAPVGPLESVIIVDRNHRIVAASDPLAVDRRFTDPEEIARLDAALYEPQIRRIEGQRADGRSVVELSVGVPNARGEPMGVVRLRYVGGEIARAPEVPRFRVTTRPRLWGPLVAGLVAVLGVGFGIWSTVQIFRLTRRIEAMAEGEEVAPGPLGGPAGHALSLIEEKLDRLSSAVRRDDLLVASLTEALREGVILVDPDGRPVIANRQARGILGLAPGRTEEDFRELLERNPELAALVREGFSRHRAVREHSLALRAGDREREVQVTSYVLHDGHAPTGILLVLKDRASIGALERNLREACRLQTIVDLTGSVAHEVKNPLGAIGIHLETLRRRLARLEGEGPGLVEKVRVLREEIDRLQEILEEWLGLTSPEERAPSPAPVADVIASVARLLHVEARHRNVELVADVVGDPGRVSLGEARLRQVLLNLALNALQAMPRGGRLVLRAERTAMGAVIEVSDTGEGIPPEHRDSVFEFHFTTREGGSGLGLPICRQLVEEAGGRVVFTSVVGRGTTFRVFLPAAGAGMRPGGRRVPA